MVKNNRHILVVDDDEVTRKLISFNLLKEGYDVFETGTVKNASDILNSTPIDLVFCDVIMEGVDGFEFCKSVRRVDKHKALPFVFITSSGSNEVKLKAIDIGADDFLIKPVDIPDLILKTNSILKRIEIYKAYGIRNKLEGSFRDETMKLMLVDDDPIIIKILNVTFKTAGIDCHTFGNAKAALEKVDEIKPDLILADLSMPDMDGFEFRKILLTNPIHRHIPFVFITSNDSDNVILEGYDLDIKDFIVKSTNPKVITAKITNLLKSLKNERQNTLMELQQAADSISMEVVPKKPAAIEGFDVEHWNVPYKGTPGGDFIDYIELDEDHTAIILGDVMGKKWGAWFFAFAFIGYLRSAIRMAITQSRTFSAKEILKNVNHSVYSDAKISEIFTTVSLLIVNNKNNTVQYSGAGDLGLLYYNSKSQKVEQLNSEGMLLGIKKDGDYDNVEITMSAGDCIVAVTDGVAEARDADNEQFGMERLKACLGNSMDCGADLIGIKNEFQKFTDKKFDDDVSLIYIKRK
ncbi:hypothetical protein BH10BAC5_BH10BAC5_16410 [soil metagenome]